MPLSSGTRLGPYEILSPLGAGGMGEVYRARDSRLGREVAVKVLPASFAQDPDRLSRFEQEARAVSALNHPNILTLHDVGQHDGAPYVVTELLEGNTLRERMAAGALTPRRALELALQIAHGLSAAHERGVVHRDLKPENVFVTKDGRLKILDFGLAKLAEPATAASQTNLPTAVPATDPGTVLGTLGYMSPEQVRGKAADPRSDIFAFGAILYEMLAGRRAFHGDTAADTMSAILTKEAPELSSTNRNVSPGLDRVVRHCLEKDPERRFHSAHDLAFDLEALSESSGTGSAGSRPARSGTRIALAGAAAVALLAAAGILWSRRSGSAAAFDSVAVLPFANATRDPETEYLSDGITESITNSLSRLPELRVAARSSAFRYKGREEDLQKAGRELKVRAVVSGKVVQRGDTLSVQADLVDVGNGAQIWGNHYDRKLSDILAIQEEIARDIATKLRPRMTGDQRERAAKRSTDSTEAYQLYIKGRHAWGKRTAEGLSQAREYFEKAIETDPAFALAHSGLADAYVVLPSYSLMAPIEAFPKARAAARRALEIDDTIAPAHAALAFVLDDYDRDLAGAIAEYRRSIELDPNWATAHFWYAQCLSSAGRHEEAIAEIRRARELDPLSAIIHANVVRVLVWARRLDIAVEEGQQVVRENPGFHPAHYFLGLAYMALGENRAAATAFRRSSELLGQTPMGIWRRGTAEALEGKRAEALATIEELKRMAEDRYVSPSYIAIIFIALGDKDQAFEWLDRAWKDRSYEMSNLTVDPMFDSIRSDPRFADLARKVGYPPPAR